MKQKFFFSYPRRPVVSLWFNSLRTPDFEIEGIALARQIFLGRFLC